jgi:hypothetical protein
MVIAGESSGLLNNNMIFCMEDDWVPRPRNLRTRGMQPLFREASERFPEQGVK